MFCNSCGEALAYSSGHCTKCGTRIPEAAEANGTLAAAMVQRPPSTRLEIRGLGGWLLLFWAGITILGPLYSARSILRYPPTVASIVLAAVAALSIVTGVYIFKEHPLALELVKVYFMTRLVVAGMVFITIQYQLPIQIVTLPSGRIGYYFVTATVVQIFIWWLYFKQSVRVRNTFGRNL